MDFSTKFSPDPTFYFIFFLGFFLKLCVSDPRATEAALVCTNRTAPMSERRTFVSNFIAALDSLTPLVAFQGYASVVNGTGHTKVYAFAECMKDLSPVDCDLCFAQCKTQILKCWPFQLGTRGGTLFYDGCFIRYDDHNFTSEILGQQDKFVCGSKDFGGNKTVFGANVVELMKNLSFEAPKNDGFFVGSMSRGNVSVYGLAQCWELVNGSGCERCLADGVSKISSCAPKDEGRVLNSGCYLRYSTYKFYNNSGSHHFRENNGGNQRLAITLAVTSSSLALLLIVAMVAYFWNKKIMKQRRERKQFGALLATVNKSELNFSYETLEEATNYFNESNKLGQGGSGSVYKGILPDGTTVAIKRLFFNSRQWVDHFFNEVNLISGMSHKNLVRLLGCSITGPESLLVYEFVPNQSLQDHLLDKKKVHQLSWEVRCNIILGYMAPEYVVLGKLTEKADVYSFGVLLMELVSGKRNNSFCQNSYSLIQTVWNLHRVGRLHEIVDETLKDNYQEEEVFRVLQIGLLCVQACVELRPSMSMVVKMLMDDNFEIPNPTQPPFLNSSSAEISLVTEPMACLSRADSLTNSNRNSLTQSWIEPR
ncbi:Gnk2-homologous domain [Dillenia turbinata]|uniref:Gnk2-homologous domain n=1 Tax=Dillenia turbinata TaxID=194707 RepID=A0AAN8VBB2_9MAGN